MEKLKAIWAWIQTVAWANVFLWVRDTFGSIFGTIWLLLHSQNLAEIFPILPSGFNIAELINVAIFTKVMRWSFTLTLIGLIGNRAFNRPPVMTVTPTVEVNPNLPKGA